MFVSVSFEQLFLDDNVRNVAAGKALGLRTVLVISLLKLNRWDKCIFSVADLRS